MAGRTRRRRQDTPRARVVKIKLSEAEFAELEAAAARHRRARAAFAAEAVMAAARGEQAVGPGGITDELRAALVELMQARTQARRIGTLLNQAVTILHATGGTYGLGRATAAATRALAEIEAASRNVSRRLPPHG